MLVQRLEAYVQHIRPLLPDGPLLFPSTIGKEMDHLSRSVAQLEEKFGLQVPTATESRHAAATAVTTSRSGEDQQLASHAMARSWRTQQKYYADVKGTKQAVEGFLVMEELRQGASRSPVRKRKDYDKEEIETRDVPAESECLDFLRQHPLERTAKQVRDITLPPMEVVW